MGVVFIRNNLPYLGNGHGGSIAPQMVKQILILLNAKFSIIPMK